METVKNKQVELKLYFSDIEHVMNFIGAQHPFGDVSEKFECLKENILYNKNKVQELLNKFSSSWVATSEHVNNLILLMESYLERKEESMNASTESKPASE